MSKPRPCHAIPFAATISVERQPVETTAFILLTSPVGLVAALIAASTATVVAVVRRPAVPRLTLAVCGSGLLLLCLAAGGVAWERPVAKPVAVLVDLSASTRTAVYREPGALHARLAELLGR